MVSIARVRVVADDVNVDDVEEEGEGDNKGERNDHSWQEMAIKRVASKWFPRAIKTVRKWRREEKESGRRMAEWNKRY